jgi:hypothetical protein
MGGSTFSPTVTYWRKLLEGQTASIYELPLKFEPVEKLSVACVWPSIRVEKRLIRDSRARFGASRAGLCSHERACIAFFNRLVSSRKLIFTILHESALGRLHKFLYCPLV